MKVAKELDCVQMKTEIQERLLREIAEVVKKKPESVGKSDCWVPDLGKVLRAKMAMEKEHTECAPAV